MSDDIKKSAAIGFDMPFEKYQGISAINASCIAHGRKSMLHMHHAMTTRSTATPAMIMGTLAHYVVLEGGDGIVCCDARRGTKAWDAAIEKAGGDDRMICKTKDYDTIMAMRDKVMQCKDAAWLIYKTRHEVSMTWEYKSYGLAKGRMDMYGDSPHILCDYKTTGDPEPRAFFSTAERLGYHVKMGWYVEGVESLTGKLPAVYVIVQEAKAPHDCYVCEIPQTIIKDGREEAVEIAKMYRCCESANVFSGVCPDGIIDYERPAWVLGGDNAEVNMEGVEA